MRESLLDFRGGEEQGVLGIFGDRCELFGKQIHTCTLVADGQHREPSRNAPLIQDIACQNRIEFRGTDAAHVAIELFIIGVESN